MAAPPILPIADLDLPLDEAVETLTAIRAGEVDALIVQHGDIAEIRLLRDPGLSYRLLIENMNEGDAAALEGALTTSAGAPRVELALAGGDGAAIPVQFSLAHASVDGVPLVCAVVTDLRAHRREQERYDAACAGIEARDRLVSVAAHELCTPLQGLLLAIESIGRKLRAAPELAADLRSTIERAERQGRRLSDLVDVLMDVSTIERGGIRLTRGPVDLGELARTVVDRHGPELRAGGYQVRLDVRPVTGHWDRLRLEQVLSNLVSNAIKYGRGRPIAVEVGHDGEVARMTVIDHGDGIPADARERVFAAYQRSVGDRSVPGVGLGLYVAREIVRAHGGRIAIEGEAGEGARFVVELPLDAAQPR